MDYEELAPEYSHMEADPDLLRAYRANAEALGRHFDADDAGTPLPPSADTSAAAAAAAKASSTASGQ